MATEQTSQAHLGFCYLCGAEATTEDHIPPKCFFGQPRPDDLVWAPACLKCNNGFSEMDLKARTVIAMLAGRLNPEEASGLWQDFLTTLRTKRTRQLARLRESLSTILVYDKHTHSYGHPIPIPTRPFNLVFIRIAKGYYYLKTGRRMPENTKFTVLLYQGRNGFPVTLVDTNQVVRGPMTLNWRIADDDEHSALWQFAFYRVVHVTVVARSLSEQKPAATPLGSA